MRIRYLMVSLVALLVVVTQAAQLAPDDDLRRAALAVPDTLWIDPGGTEGPCDDARDASEVTERAPWCTIGRAVAAGPAGARVVLRGGTYPSAAVEAAGRRSLDLTFAAAPGEAVAIEALELREVSDVRFEGLHVQGGTVLQAGVERVRFTRVRFSPGSLVLQGGTRDILVDDSDFTVPRGTGIMFSSGPKEPPVENVVVRGSRFAGCGVVSISVRNFRHVRIEGNEFERSHSWNGEVHPDVIRTFAGGSDLVIRNNYLHDNNAIGIFVKDGHVDGLRVENNLIVRTTAPFKAVNVYDLENATFANNTIVDGGGGVIVRKNASAITMINNIFDSLAVENPASVVRSEANLIGDPAASGPEAFVDRSRGDYRPAAGSPAIDAGTSVGAPARDARGRARLDDLSVEDRGDGPKTWTDIGAFESRPPRPGLVLRGRAHQRLGDPGGVAVRISCAFACVTRVSGRAVGGGPMLRARSRRVRVPSGGRAIVRLRFSDRARARLRTRLARSRVRFEASARASTGGTADRRSVRITARL